MIKSALALAAGRVLFSLLEEEDGGLSEHGTVAAAAGNLRLAVRVLTHEFTLRFGALWFSAFPVTSWLFTDGFAFGLGSLIIT